MFRVWRKNIKFMIDFAYTFGNSIIIDDKVQIVSSIISNFPYKPLINGTVSYKPVEIDPVTMPNGKTITCLHHLENYKLFNNLDVSEIEENVSKHLDKRPTKSLVQDVLRDVELAVQYISRDK